MNILFALYNDFNCNSASHVHSFANELSRFGHDCIVAVPWNKETIANLGSTSYRGVDFGEVLAADSVFADGRGPDILHAWTPREIVRHFCDALREKHECRLFIQLEDNEQHLLACALGMPWKRIISLDDDELDLLVKAHLTHPRKGFEFMSSADGITVIIDRLQELVPKGIPTLELWPSAEQNLFRPLPKLDSARTLLGIPKNSAVIVYTGNAHAANAHEMRSLYLAVAILNREGQPVTLVRAGRDFYPFLGYGEQWARKHSIELGLVPHKEIPAVLALADILVQPGRADPFNDYRFPSKLPEFLSAGRPVVVPNANIASRMIHRKHAYVLSNASALSIAGAVREILDDSCLRERLSQGALEFFKEHLSWSLSAERLNDYYWQSLRSKESSSPSSTQRDISHRTLAMSTSAAL